MSDRLLFSRSATDDEIAAEVLASMPGGTVEEARRVMVEEGDTPIGDLQRRGPTLLWDLNSPEPALQEARRRKIFGGHDLGGPGTHHR